MAVKKHLAFGERVLQEDFMENDYKGRENGDYQFTRPEDRRTDYGRPQNNGRNLNGW